MRAGSVGVMICFLSLCLLVGVWEAVPLAKGNTTPSQCKQEKDLLVNACKSAVINNFIGRKPSAYCCQLIRAAQVECVCPYVTPKIANLIPVQRTIKQIEGCGRSVPHNFKCGSVTTP